MNNIYYQEYLRQLAEEQARQNQGDGISKINGLVSDVNSLGNNLSTVGNVIKNNVDSEVAQKLGSKISGFGGNLSNTANAASNTLNAPQSYFKGVAQNALGNAATKAGEYLAGKTGLAGLAGNGLTSLGASLSGTGAAAGAGATAAGTAAGTAGAASAGVGATAAGSAAAGGAAAGGSAAGGAAAAGPIGALVALGIMAAQGTNRKRAKKSGEALMNSLNETTKAMNEESDQRLAQTQQNTSALQEQAAQALSGGIPTGGAAQIQDVNGNVAGFPTTKDAFAQSLRTNGWDDHTINSALNGYNLGNKDMATYIDEYNKGAADGQRILPPQQTPPETQSQTGQITENAKNSILAKFASGIGDLARGYNENRNTAFSPENLIQNQFANKEVGQSQELTNYQNQLRNNGLDENIVNAVAQGKNSGNKDIANWISNNQAALAPQENITSYTDKSKMARVGEALGTVARVATNPTVQGLVAGGLSTALTGNPLYGLGQGYKFANQRAMNNIYQQVLKENGVDVNAGVFGNIDSSGMNALMTPQYKNAMNNIALARIQETKNYHDMMMKYYGEKLNEQRDYHAGQLENGKARATASLISANKKGSSSKGGSKTPKPQEHPDWAGDLAGYSKILTNPQYVDKVPEAKARFINKYGVDPMKYIKL